MQMFAHNNQLAFSFSILDWLLEMCLSGFLLIQERMLPVINGWFMLGDQRRHLIYLVLCPKSVFSSIQVTVQMMLFK